MASRRICLWLVFMIITNSVGEDTRSVLMSLITGSKFQCANTTCLPFANIITSNIMKCQMACLVQTYCRAASFHQSTFNCELFTDMSNEIANMLTDTDITTMIVIDGTRSPPEPITTTTTATTSTTTSTTTETTTTTTTTTTTFIFNSTCSQSYCCTFGPTPCVYNNHACSCNTAGDGSFFCPGCAGQGPSTYYGGGGCYYSGWYYSGC
ncbi:unnamed protein product [Adineta steineri]|uniref:Apple domain-containing protein n=1 Tax=Adineta steineri TaxID=433720 RepID=A0A819T7J7_9BILA|nr:unnamed protein product [Adineta steineri]CAF4072097.1 unnamed protein product [Adineta steineri]